MPSANPEYAYELRKSGLAEAGIHALIGKPVTHDTLSARKAADAFATKGLVGGVGHIERYNPALQSVRARIEAAELRTVYQVTTGASGKSAGHGVAG